jgi:hypothetical protein
MPGLKIEYFSHASIETTPTAEYVASLEPAHQDQFVRRGDIEVFTVHLFVLELEIFTQACCDWVTRVNHPQALFLSNFSPFQITLGAHQLAENPGKMR